MLESASLRTCLLEAGCNKVGHLLRASDTLLHLLGTRIKATRLVERMVAEVHAALSAGWRSLTDNWSHCTVV